jgi:hypothetical protein
MISKRLMAVAAFGVAVAVPAAFTSAAGTYSATADATASTYATGAITGKTWTAYPTNGATKAIKIAQPIVPQINPIAALGMLAAPAGQAVGHARVYLQGADATKPPSMLGNLLMETGKATDCTGTNIPAPAADGSPLTGELRVQAGALAPVIGATCVGVRIDAVPPSAAPPSPGRVSLNIDITSAANVASALGTITQIDIDLDQHQFNAANILNDNPATPTTVVSDITLTQCAPGAKPCDGTGALTTAQIKETIGGTTGVTIVPSATKVTFGKAITVTGTVTRGVTGTAESVVVAEKDGPATAAVTSAASGEYTATITPTVSGQLFARSKTLLDNTLLSPSAAVTVVAPKPVLAGKAVRKGKKLTIKLKGAVTGIAYSAKVGAVKLKAVTKGTTVTFTGNGKKGATVVITASAKGITSTTLKVKIK